MQDRLPDKPLGTTGATLSDGKITYNFLLDPEKLQWSHQATYATNSVLGTDKPDTRWNSSTSTLVIPRILFISQGMTKDVTDTIQQLTSWCISGASLRFSFSSTSIERCHILRFTPVEQQWRSGKVTQAEANLDLLISREPVAVTPSTIGKPQVTYTPRERQNITNSVTEALKNSGKRAKLNIRNQSVNVATDEVGNVTVTYKSGGVAGTFRVADLRVQGIIK
ncbi:MAG: hypothetical protein KME59_21315 [Trichormus sp. ATA11-4-KO1]|jgi:hypothetical protein|nr:hypothetical protein [Trichormus sp. ATA11-4-KO1]